MKIIGWNCNGAFRKKNNEILALNPDVLVISECENPEKLKFGKLTPKPKDIIWIGDNPNKGIGIFAYGDYSFKMLKEYNPKYKFVIPLKVYHKENSFLFFCIWTKENKYDKNAGYIGQVWYAINFYSNLISNYDTIIIGDFNSNKRWDAKRPNTNHSKVVEFLKNYDIESLYHLKNKENQGDESSPTFFLHKKINKPYHIDYCFASKEVYKNKFDVKIGEFEDWIRISDHVPIIVEFKWKPQNDNIFNVLHDSIKNKLSSIDKEISTINKIKEDLLRAASLFNEGNESEKDRLRIIDNTEDLLKIFNLIDTIEKRNSGDG